MVLHYRQFIVDMGFDLWCYDSALAVEGIPSWCSKKGLNWCKPAEPFFVLTRRNERTTRMPRPLCDVNGAEYQEILRAREMIRRYGTDYKDALWAEDTLHRLKQKPLYETYNDKDLADFLKAREIYERLADAEQKRRGETAQNHSTPQYIWRTAGDGKVRREHAVNDGKIFSWDNPPRTGNPGEAFGCRCWAEAYKPAAQETVELQEKSIQTVGKTLGCSCSWTGGCSSCILENMERR
jgi:SPP1 gp7 family putative phage head morphogenesis protein